MKNYRLRYRKTDGAAVTTAAAYSRTVAEERRQELEAEGMTEVEIFEVKPGE